MNTEILVTKASGERAPFSEEKLMGSLRRAGAETDQIHEILSEIRKWLYEGIPTRKIYRIAFSLLASKSRPIAARYHLKQAIMELGPSGFPFERFIGEILKYEGHEVAIGQFIEGKCVTHEIDVIAEKGGDRILIECKYHNRQGVSSDVKTALYIHARYLDVTTHKSKPDPKPINQCWVVTNTRFTEDALKYAICSGLILVGWDFPPGNGLKDRIDKFGLYPVTCLTSITMTEKVKLLNDGIVMCGAIRDNEGLLKTLSINAERKAIVLKEIRQLCDTTKSMILTH